MQDGMKADNEPFIFAAEKVQSMTTENYIMEPGDLVEVELRKGWRFADDGLENTQTESAATGECHAAGFDDMETAEAMIRAAVPCECEECVENA